MADTDTLSRVRAALDDSERIAADRIDLTIDDGVLVLRGSVASPEDASVAGLVAEEHADAVRNELAVDAHLREQPDHPGEHDPDGGNAPDEAPDLRGSDGGMVADTARAVGENEPWDPPDQPHLAPTGADQRGVSESPTSEEPIADAGTVDADAFDRGDEVPSAPDLSAEELARSARGQHAPADPAADRKA